MGVRRWRFGFYIALGNWPNLRSNPGGTKRRSLILTGPSIGIERRTVVALESSILCILLQNAISHH